MNHSESDESEDSENDSGPEESATTSKFSRDSVAENQYKRRHKHAPAETSSKKPVSVVRNVTSGSNSSGSKSSLYSDIRFDTAFGKADLEKTRKNYSFLNEYREKELSEMKDKLRNHIGLNERQKEELKRQIQKMESRLKTFKNRDFETKVLQEYKQKVKNGEIKGPLHLKRSEQRKLVLSEKYKTMKNKDVKKALERKRKKNTEKERKLMPRERLG